MLCLPLVFSGCSNESQQEDFRLVSFETFKTEMDKIDVYTQKYNVADTEYYRTYESREPVNRKEKYVFVNNSWISFYGLPDSYCVSYLTNRINYYIEYAIEEMDNAYFDFYLGNNGFKVTADMYDIIVDAEFDNFGYLTYMHFHSLDIYEKVKETQTIKIIYSTEDISIIEANTLAVKDMYFEYDETSDSYHFLGYNQLIKPNKITIPSNHHTNEHGRKNVTLVDVYSIFHSRCVEILELGQYVSEIRNLSNSRFCTLKEIFVYRNEIFTSDEGILYSGKFKELIYCPANKEDDVNINVLCETIGVAAFSKCNNISTVKIANSVKKIDLSAFSESGIKEISMPDSIETLESLAFYRCENLKKVGLSNEIEILRTQTFADCINLEKVTIGKNTRFIFPSAFDNCSSLTNITFLGTMDEWQSVRSGDQWDAIVIANNPYVHCSDGDVEINLNNHLY